MHESAKRIYELAAKLRPGTERPSEVAALIGVTQQTLTNWESRGVSKIAALDLQAKKQINATWLLDGHGPMLIGPWPFQGITPNRWKNLDPPQKERIERNVTDLVEGFEAINMVRPSGESSASSHEDQLENAA